MDEELQENSDNFFEDADDSESPFLWEPEDNDQALRWECLSMAIRTTTADKAVKTARAFELFLREGKSGPASVS